jgi:hypothetical protein
MWSGGGDAVAAAWQYYGLVKVASLTYLMHGWQWLFVYVRGLQIFMYYIVCYAAGQCRRDGAVGYGLVWHDLVVTRMLLTASNAPVRRTYLNPDVLDTTMATCLQRPTPPCAVMVCWLCLHC